MFIYLVWLLQNDCVLFACSLTGVFSLYSVLVFVSSVVHFKLYFEVNVKIMYYSFKSYNKKVKNSGLNKDILENKYYHGILQSKSLPSPLIKFMAKKIDLEVYRLVYHGRYN